VFISLLEMSKVYDFVGQPSYMYGSHCISIGTKLRRTNLYMPHPK